jgi:uncharacterized RDD family membrane protein YckC
MQLDCPQCHRVLEYSGERPSFCAYCGHALALSQQRATADLSPRTISHFAPAGASDGLATDATGHDPEAPTLVPEISPSPRAEAVPEGVGGYRLLRQLGCGGMGAVYEAEDATGRRVALKLISAEFAQSTDAVERFRQEGRLASRVAHPRCVFVYAADEERGRPYIVMELMPGSTLRDLVEKQGPLPVDQALTKILDVIEGLQEAHRTGVIHRDVKPSNCFLEADGRVKVGDFGLAKALESSAHLTKTGSFLGTPLFASPEQIRRDPLDEQTDVYSVAATFYYLLTGRAPFQSGDAAATLARIVSDPAPSMLDLREDLPRGLDKVVLRGLERHRERRWRSLEELREALLPFSAGHLSIGGMGIRFGAYLIDYLLLALINTLVTLGALFLGKFNNFKDPGTGLRPGWYLVVFSTWMLYFFVPEAIWGCSAGKRLLRLRVSAGGGDRAPLPRLLARSLVFYTLANLGGLVALLIAALFLHDDLPSRESALRNSGIMIFAGLFSLVGTGLGIICLIAPMRARNGYRGLHEFLSGTRVMSLPWPQRRRTYSSPPLRCGLQPPSGVPAQLGGFVSEGPATWNSEYHVLLADDRSLGRKAWLWLRDRSAPALTPARRATSRSARLRWLATGQEQGVQWNAFAASAGCTLPDVIKKEGRLPWSDARPLLEQLVAELHTSQQESTLPSTLTMDQVWVQPNGGLQLLDFPLGDCQSGTQRTGTPAGHEERPKGEAGPLASLSLLRQAAILMLEGHPELTGNIPKVRIEAPLPQHAQKLLQGLLDLKAGYTSVDEFRKRLAVTRDKPTEVTRPRRIAHLAGFAVVQLVGLCCMLLTGWTIDLVNPLFAHIFVLKAERTQQRLEEGTARDFIFASTNPAPFAPIVGRLQLEADLDLRDRLQGVIEENRLKEDAGLDALTWYTRYLVQALERSMEAQINALNLDRDSAKPFLVLPQLRQTAEQDAKLENPLSDGKPFFDGWLPAVLTAWPILWILWAFLVRGALSFRIAGLDLVRSNGRPALRIQCAWRALLVWLPPTALLVLSAWCHAWYWRQWQPEGAQSWMLWIAWISWWCAALLPASYAALAIWFPSRSLHDRLSGTYLVPN